MSHITDKIGDYGSGLTQSAFYNALMEAGVDNSASGFFYAPSMYQPDTSTPSKSAIKKKTLKALTPSEKKQLDRYIQWKGPKRFRYNLEAATKSHDDPRLPQWEGTKPSTLLFHGGRTQYDRLKGHYGNVNPDAALWASPDYRVGDAFAVGAGAINGNIADFPWSKYKGKVGYVHTLEPKGFSYGYVGFPDEQGYGQRLGEKSIKPVGGYWVKVDRHGAPQHFLDRPRDIPNFGAYKKPVLIGAGAIGVGVGGYEVYKHREDIKRGYKSAETRVQHGYAKTNDRLHNHFHNTKDRLGARHF